MCDKEEGTSHERMQSDDNSSKLIIVIGSIEFVFFLEGGRFINRFYTDTGKCVCNY